MPLSRQVCVDATLDDGDGGVAVPPFAGSVRLEGIEALST